MQAVATGKLAGSLPGGVAWSAAWWLHVEQGGTRTPNQGCSTTEWV